MKSINLVLNGAFNDYFLKWQLKRHRIRIYRFSLKCFVYKLFVGPGSLWNECKFGTHLIIPLNKKIMKP